jgi:hypothetical protein
MNNEQFDKIVEERCNKIKQVLSIKAKEYARNDDRLHNFVRAGVIMNMSKERALHGFLMKHFISYLDILEDIDNGKIPSNEMIDEKLGDIINYFILMEASIKERNMLKV